MAKNTRRLLRGWTIDSENAQILDDGFRVSQKKNGAFNLKFFIAETSEYYAEKSRRANKTVRPGLIDPQKLGDLPDIDQGYKRVHLSLNKSFRTQPAICVSIDFDKKGVLLKDTIKLEAVEFENKRQLTENDATDLVRNGDEEMRVAHELAQRIDYHCGHRRLEKINSSAPGSFIQTTFSNIANAAITHYARENNIPLVYQNRKAHIEALNTSISTREEAYTALDILFECDDCEKIQASCYAKLDDHRYSNQSAGNIQKGFHHFARFSSPMQSLMDCANLMNVAHFIKTEDTNTCPFDQNDMGHIAEATTAIKVSHQLKEAAVKSLERENDVRKTFDNNDADHLRYDASLPHIGYVLKRIFEHNEQTGEGRPELTHACIARIEKFKHNPAYLLKIALINNPQKTEAQQELAQVARKKIFDQGLSEEAIRLSVEQAGDFEAFFIEKRTVGAQTVYQPILIKDGERYSTPRIAPYDTHKLDHQLAVARSFKELINAVADQTLCLAHKTDIEWSKKSKKLLQAKVNNSALPKAINFS